MRTALAHLRSQNRRLRALLAVVDGQNVVPQASHCLAAMALAAWLERHCAEHFLLQNRRRCLAE